MTIDEFVKKYDGKGIDYDGAFSTQCVDLYRQYVKEVLGYPQSPSVNGAKDIWGSFLPEYFKRIENTPFGVPEKGDIVIWGADFGKYGHVAVFIDGNDKKFNSFDQNYPTGSLCHIQSHTYRGVLGWLRPLKSSTDVPTWLKTLLQENNLSINSESDIRSIFDKAKRYDEEVNQLKEQVKSVNESLADRAGEVSRLIEQNQKLTNRATEAEEQFNKVRGERDQATWEKQKLEIKVNLDKETIEELTNKIAEFKPEIVYKVENKDFTVRRFLGIKLLVERK